MSWEFVKLKKVLKQYRVTHIVENEREYKQVTISKHDGVKFRGTKKGKDIGRKRQFIIDLKQHPNTLMLVRQGVYEGAIGIAPPEVDECIATENMPMFSVEGIDIDYLNLIIQSPYFKEELEKIPTTGSAQKSIHERQILEIEIPFPSLDEQELIVDSFKKNQDGLNEISTALTHQLELVKQLRQAFLREAMQGKLVPQDSNDEPASVLLEKIKAEKERLIKEMKIKNQKPLPPITEGEIPFEIPDNWVWCRLGELCNTITKGSSPKWQGVKYVDSYEKGILFITSKNVDSFKIDLSDSSFVEAKFNEIEPRSILQKGDLLTNIVGASIGRTALFDLDFVANINQAVCILRIEHKFIDKPYLLNLMNSEFVINLMLEMQFAPGRANLSMSNLGNFPIPLPPLSEQQRIVAKLDELMAYCDDLEVSVKESQEQNELLLQQVLREALEPKDVELV